MVGKRPDPTAALEALRRHHRPRLEALAAAAVDAGARPWLVGGAVRDALLGATVAELDVAVEGGPRPWGSLAVAEALARRLGGELRTHPRFGTATVAGDRWRVDLAGTRSERYPRPGALPEVSPAGLQEDLGRRDVTVNAIALGLDGELRAVPHALEDLKARLLRVLHERSFVDDPTRALRVGRYASRLGFAVEAVTERLARAARLETVSAARVGAELRLALSEPGPVDVLERWEALGVLPGGLRPRRELAERALALLGDAGDRALTVLAACHDGADLRRLGFPAAQAALVATAAGAPPLSADPGALEGRPPEAVALAGARGDAGAARRWLEELRHVRLEIDGTDLIAAGVPAGPEVGRRLRAALRAKRAGRAHTRQEELAAALAAGEDLPSPPA